MLADIPTTECIDGATVYLVGSVPVGALTRTYWLHGTEDPRRWQLWSRCGTWTVRGVYPGELRTVIVTLAQLYAKRYPARFVPATLGGREAVSMLLGPRIGGVE